MKTCRFCPRDTCYHCQKCGAKFDREDHKPTCDYSIKCVGCSDTGISSSGRTCYPCSINGRIKVK